jgi:RHS repeat-associated protein
LVAQADGSLSARYEYGPFGEAIRATGVMGKKNPIRFSTKYTDDQTGLLYYGYRYYNPTTGRWMSRDPIEEEGGHNLYAFINNEPSSGLDVLGLRPCYRNVVSRVSGSLPPNIRFNVYRQSQRAIPKHPRAMGMTVWDVPIVAMSVSYCSTECCHQLQYESITMDVHTWSRWFARNHEEGHVTDAAEMAFAGTVSYVLSLSGCYGSLLQAQCYKQVAETFAPRMYHACGFRDSIAKRDDLNHEFYRNQHSIWDGRCLTATHAFERALALCSQL